MADNPLDKGNAEARRQRRYINPEVLQRQVQALSREPFRALLTTILEAEPDPDRLKAFANKYPDKWGNLLGTVARLSGFHDKLEIDGTIEHNHVHSLSDAELVQRLQELETSYATLTPRTFDNDHLIEGSPQPAENPEAADQRDQGPDGPQRDPESNTHD